MSGEYCWSTDDENFSYETLDELLDSNKDIKAGDVVSVGVKQPHDTNWVDADDVISMIGERADDVAGEYAENFPNVSEQAIAELDQFLSSWQAKHCVASFYSVKDIVPHVITESDIEYARAGQDEDQ